VSEREREKEELCVRLFLVYACVVLSFILFFFILILRCHTNDSTHRHDKKRYVHSKLFFLIVISITILTVVFNKKSN